MLQDVRFAFKLLWKDRAFSATALITLALCIGANTATFTVLNAVVLRPLPFPDSSRILSLYNVYPGAGLPDRGANGVPDYLDRRQMTDVFDSVALTGGTSYAFGNPGSPVRLRGIYVTPDYFRVLRTSPALGRAFAPEDAVPGKDHSAILSYPLWRDSFGKDPNVLGRDIRLNSQPYRIVGVMPETFDFLSREIGILTPFAFEPRQTTDDARHSNNWDMIARLKPGVTLAYARQRIDALNRSNVDRLPKFRQIVVDARFATRVVPLKDEVVREVRPMLYIMQAAVIFVLLIGCVNVANLLLVRSNIRMKELAIRFSLGANRWRIARQLLTESLFIAALGGVFGIFAGYGGVRLLSYLHAQDMPRGADIRIDATVLAASAAVALLTGLVFGSVPVVHLFRRDLNAVFRQTERTGTVERHALWTRSALVVCQISLAFILLIGSALLTISFRRILSVDPGFKPQGLLTASVSLPRTRYPDDKQFSAFVERFGQALRGLPGATHAGLTSFLPFAGGLNASVITIEGYTLGKGEVPPTPAWNTADEGYLRAMRIPLLRGRNFAPSDAKDAPRVALIDDYLARRYWPGRDPIGQKIRRGIDDGDTPCTIIGVVGNVKYSDLADVKPNGQVYFYYKQFSVGTVNAVVRTAGDPGALAQALRRELLRIDPELPLARVLTMEERMDRSLRSRRAAMVVSLVFAVLALVLSAVGIYGVLAYAVTQRTREFGIRVALGADARDVLGMVAGQGVKLAFAGLAVGVAGAFALTRLMSSLLYGVKPTDPAIFLLMAAALMSVAVVASLIPSLRAVRIRPAVALRYE